MRGPMVSQPDSSASRTAWRSSSESRRSNSGMSGDVAIPRPPRVWPAPLFERLRDLGDAVRHRETGPELQDVADLVEGDLVVARVLVALDEADLPAAHLPLDLLDQHLLRVVLIRAAGVEDLALRLVARCVEHGADRSRRVVDVDIGPPELLAEDVELPVAPEVARELVDREVEAHARRRAVDRGE